MRFLQRELRIIETKHDRGPLQSPGLQPESETLIPQSCSLKYILELESTKV